MVDGVADTCVEYQSEEGPGDGKGPDNLVLVTPSLACLFKDSQEEYASESHSTG